MFLAGEEARKIKRAVRFPNMDLATLDKRQAVCAREVEINRRTAPEIYLGCVPITRAADGRLAFGGDGEPVEWAVRMRRFDQSAQLSGVAAAGTLTPGLGKDARSFELILDVCTRACRCRAGRGMASALERLGQEAGRKIDDSSGRGKRGRCLSDEAN